ncbi:MAG: flagellar hook-basal body complex protein [Pseudotabrizicola sp.]|uniref:flagellar hook protein FlgE n=1 Tax=Pseudotabrizicola sp. TaxID=2939647 RepID=UPI00271AA074|nr:flagellar hook-basal body complex protein [Pseudotabrizicola sp.]MDO8883656.1 flagellar hook-basal body complex protein [Pseudotabrizicola sp.]MDP2081813.1 flagellar hook-basal body complex protein [Pseudotabrizicola sp.]MDZ7573897.1 flagellar hook-basal body complex protein [Pseudotabrizicola sp.]
MTISSSLNAGVAGLNANAARLATISDNIANSSTYGYKRAAAEFESMVLSGGRGSGKYSAGGVRTSSYRLIDERGGIVSTSNALDMAVTGRGMLPVMPSVRMSDGGMGTQPMMMTTTGSFRMDAEGVLRTESGLVLLGWPANQDGTIPAFSRDTLSGLQPVVISANQTVADPTTAIGLAVNLPSIQTSVGASGDPFPIMVEYYNNLGSAESLNISFTPTVPVPPSTAGTNTWTMEIRDSASNGAVVGEYTLVFDDTRGAGGTLASVTTVSGGAYNAAVGTFDLTVASGPITMTIGRPGEPGGMTQLADSFIPTGITKNGSPTGTLASVEIDENGYLLATYDTGFIRRIYQIPLVDVPNINGLTPLSNQTFQVSPQSGAFYLWNAGEGPTGSIAGYAREASATDVAAELTALITTQRAYSSNAKVIQTVDEMLQETTNIKR